MRRPVLPGPTSYRPLSSKGWLLLSGFVVAYLVVAVVIANSVESYDLSRVGTIVNFMGLAAAWNLVGGVAGRMSLGHAALFGVGTYTAAWSMSQELPPIPAVLAAALVAGFGSLVFLPTFRVSGFFFAIITLAMATLAGQLAAAYAPGQTRGLFFTTVRPDSTLPYYMTCVVLLIAVLLTVYMTRGRIGLALRASRIDNAAASSVGVSAERYQAGAFVVSAALTGALGGIYAVHLGFVEPVNSFALTWTVDPLIATILGGAGTVTGPLLGSIVWQGLDELVRSLGLAAGAALVLKGVALVGLTLAVPKGLVGVIGALGRLVRRRLQRTPVPVTPDEDVAGSAEESLAEQVLQ